METLGGRVKTARELRGWSQAELGKRVSQLIRRDPPYGKAAVQKWEAGTTEMPPGDVKWALAQLFDASQEVLLWGPRQKPRCFGSTIHSGIEQRAARYADYSFIDGIARLEPS